jgi:DNA-directed RNA polymerase specialized sigma24 family protein
MDDRYAEEHSLESAWPPFLDLLDSRPREASRSFADFGYRLLRVCPPRAFAQLSQDEREDMVQIVLMHCISDGFRVLRRFKPHGTPFAAWLLTVAGNKTIDEILRRRRDETSITPDIERLLPAAPGTTGDPLLHTTLRRHLDAMGEKCRLLLSFLAEGLKPREMTDLIADLLGTPSYTNVQASDDLRYCRGLLKRKLEAEGIR